MKKLSLTFAFVFTLALSGCVTLGYNPNTGSVSLGIGGQPVALPLPQKGGFAK